MELHLGKMKSKEIAQWLGISYNTYKNRINKYLPELDYYCDYEVIYGGIKVNNIYIAEYVKNLTSKDSEDYLALVKQSNSGLCTIAGMARKIAVLFPDTWGRLSDSMVKKRLRQAGIALFGPTNLPTYRQQEEHYSGPCGYKEYTWAIKLNDFNEYRFLTEEEDKIFDNLLDSYNINSKEMALREQVEKDYKQQLIAGTLSPKEYVAKTEKIEFFPQLLSKFKALTGLTLVHATYHDVLESIF